MPACTKKSKIKYRIKRDLLEGGSRPMSNISIDMLTWRLDAWNDGWSDGFCRIDIVDIDDTIDVIVKSEGGVLGGVVGLLIRAIFIRD